MHEWWWRTNWPVPTVIGRYDKPPKLNSPVTSSSKRRQYSGGEAILTAISRELLELLLPTNRNPENSSVSEALHYWKLQKKKREREENLSRLPCWFEYLVLVLGFDSVSLYSVFSQVGSARLLLAWTLQAINPRLCYIGAFLAHCV